MRLIDYLLEHNDLDLGYYYAFDNLYRSPSVDSYKDRINTTSFLTGLIIDNYIEHHNDANRPKYMSLIMSIFEKENELIRVAYSDHEDDEYVEEYDGDIIQVYNIVAYSINRLLSIALIESKEEKLDMLKIFLDEFDDDLSELIVTTNLRAGFISESSFMDQYNSALFSPSYYGIALFYIAFLTKTMADRIYYTLRPEEYASGMQLLNDIYETVSRSAQVADGMFHHTVPIIKEEAV